MATKKNTILIVEDGEVEKLAHRAAAEKTMPKGYNVVVAGSYEEAIPHLASGNVALLITDNQFPSNFGDKATLEGLRTRDSMSDEAFAELLKTAADQKANPGVELVRRLRSIDKTTPVVWNSSTASADSIEKLHKASGAPQPAEPFTDDTKIVRFNENTVAVRKGGATLEAIKEFAGKLPLLEQQQGNGGWAR